MGDLSRKELAALIREQAVAREETGDRALAASFYILAANLEGALCPHRNPLGTCTDEDCYLASKLSATPAQSETEEKWIVRLTCCGYDNGTYEADSWEEAEKFRESYTSGEAVEKHGYSAEQHAPGHRRSGVIESRSHRPQEEADYRCNACGQVVPEGSYAPATRSAPRSERAVSVLSSSTVPKEEL